MSYFTQREHELLGDRYDQLFHYKNEIASKGVSLNLTRMSSEKFLGTMGEFLEKSPFEKYSFLLKDPNRKLGNHPYHKAGVFYIQEPSASAAVQFLDIAPGELVLDLCAAPGGKSSQILSRLSGKGVLFANEYNTERANILKYNLERMGACNAVVLNEDAESISKAFPVFFDKILIDAPCSGEGMFRKEEAAVRQHNPGLVKQCAEMAESILDYAANCLKPGGVLVFSTCTFSAEEDEMQIGRFLFAHPEFELENCVSDFGQPGEANRCGSFPFDVGKVKRIWPCDGGEGHFIARLRKKNGEFCCVNSSAKRKKDFSKTVKCSEWITFLSEYFPSLVDKQYNVINDSVILPAYSDLPGKLKILRNGVLAGKIIKGRFEPDHHLFMAYGQQCANQESMQLSDERVLSFLKGEEIKALSSHKGWCAAMVDNCPMGGGKTSNGVVKNHLPKALRNLK